MPTVFTPPVSTYVPLATYTVTGSPDAEVLFSSIPASFRDIVIVCVSRSTFAGSSNGPIQVQLNGDTGSNYSWARMFGTGSGSGTSTATSSATAMDLGRQGEASGDIGNTIIQIMDYSATDKHTTALGRANVANQVVYATAGRWANNNAVNAVKLIDPNGSFEVGSTFSLYGIE